MSDKPMEEYKKSELELEEERQEAKREEESREKKSQMGLQKMKTFVKLPSKLSPEDPEWMLKKFRGDSLDA